MAVKIVKRRIKDLMTHEEQLARGVGADGRRRTLASSEKIRAGHAKRGTRTEPVILRDVTRPKLVMLEPSRFNTIHVDQDAYQRAVIGPKVNQLIHVIRSGGCVPDPVTMVKRADGTLWIIDGLQRYHAHRLCEAPLSALIYETPTEGDERDFFLVMNTQWGINANTRVKAWRGPAAKLLHDLNEDPGSPYFNQINFGMHFGRRFHAMPLIKGMVAAMTGLSTTSGAAHEVLRRSDTAWVVPGAAARAKRWLDLVALAHPKGYAHANVLIAYGLAAHHRWNGSGKLTLPSPRAIGSMKRINWTKVASSMAHKYLPLIQTAIERRWREAA
jgi:hypothetical protein